MLFFLNGRGTNSREVVELKQRFDFEPQMVFWTRIIDRAEEHWQRGLPALKLKALLNEDVTDARFGGPLLYRRRFETSALKPV